MSNYDSLYQTVSQVMAPKKGILASDERPSSANKNLLKAGIEIPDSMADEIELRRRYRELFINTPDMEEFVSGIIIHDETFWQNDSTGKAFRVILKEKKVHIVIKVDEGTMDLPGFLEEEITVGLDGLAERLTNYYKNGATVAKWRAVIKISDQNNLPTNEAIYANAQVLSEYAKMCHDAGIVPIIEPEVLMSGDHSIEKSHEVTKNTLKIVFDTFNENKINLKATILKTSMVINGKDSLQKATSEEIAQRTVQVLKDSVPKETGGVVFLSGGQSPDEASINLNEIAKLEPLPWPIAFSYLRAIEGPVAQVWQGKDENTQYARDVFIEMLRKNVLADQGLLS